MAVILNYRVELCRACYFKRTHHCRQSDSYISNQSCLAVGPGGECRHFRPTPWLVFSPNEVDKL